MLGNSRGQYLQISDDCRQQIVEVVSDPASQLANRLHLQGMMKLFFGRELLGQITDEPVEDVALTAAQRSNAHLNWDLCAVATQHLHLHPPAQDPQNCYPQKALQAFSL